MENQKFHNSKMEMVNKKVIKKNFEKSGYIILKNFFDKKNLDDLSKKLWLTSYYYFYKIKPYRKFLNNINSNKLNFFNKFSEFFNFFEKDEKKTLHVLQKMIEQNTEIKNFFYEKKLKKIYSNLLGIDDELPIFLHGPNIFINKPNTKRLLYKWHSEANYYPKRKNFLNIWFPLFNNKTKKNGTMLIKEGSHKNFDYQINEYIGYDKKTLNSENNFFQKEIPEKFLKKYNTKTLDLKIGDLIIFHRNLAHSSSLNTSNEFSFALTGRIWDFSKDYTLSSNFGITENLYSRDILNGHPEIEDF